MQQKYSTQEQLWMEWNSRPSLHSYVLSRLIYSNRAVKYFNRFKYPQFYQILYNVCGILPDPLNKNTLYTVTIVPPYINFNIFTKDLNKAKH